MSGKVYLNDRICDITEANVSVADGGFLYGAGLFETMRANNGHVFRLDDHMSRLFRSADLMGINNSYEMEAVKNAVRETLEANELKDARLRLTLTSGSVRPGDDKIQSTLLITATSLESYPEEFYKSGILAVLCPYRQNPTDPTAGHKSLNYYSKMLALDFARKRNAAEAIWFTTDGRLAEGSITNIFLVKDGKLMTPTLQTPVLGGIARKTVIELAGKNDIELEEKDLIIDDLLGADEIFITNSIMKVMPVIQVEKHEVNESQVGETSKKLISLYDEYLEKECGIEK